MQLFLDSTRSNINFELSVAGIHEVWRETSLFEHKFQARNSGQL